jgi:hypothetical protein
MRCHSPSSQLVRNFIADRRWHTVSKPDGPMKKGALPDARFAPGSGYDSGRLGNQFWAINGSHRRSFDSMRVVDRTRISGP